MLSIRPQFAQAIFSGTKKVEFRKLNIPKNIRYIILYTTAPEQKITGYFSVKDVVEASAEELWHKFKEVSGTNEDFFFNYYGRNGKGRGFVVQDVTMFKNPIPLSKFSSGEKRPPQSFIYIDRQSWQKLRRRRIS